MKSIKKFLYSPLYSLIFSISPVLLMYSINLYQTYAYTVITPLIISFLLALVSLLIFKHMYGEWHAAAGSSFITLLFFLYYGHILDSRLFENFKTNILFPIFWSLLYCSTILCISLFRKKINLASYAPALNLMAFVAFLYPIERLIYIGLLAIHPFNIQTDDFVNISTEIKGNQPDIYYIVLDGYGRSDLLKQEFNFDNQEFLNALSGMGFIVAECSQSNYSKTQTSLASALNLDYLQNLSPIFFSKNANLFYYTMAIKNNLIQRILKTAGYTSVGYATGFPWSESKVDHFLEPSYNIPLNEFDVLFIRTTFLRVIDQFIYPLSSLTDSRFRIRLNYALNSYDELSQIPSPKFVFMHILSSHTPYVLDHSGNLLSTNNRASMTGYFEQTQYASSSIVDLIKKIISNSRIKPVIVLQGDHGFYLEEKGTNSVAILNAYLINDDLNHIYPTITPVNTFRIILNNYFNTNYPLLDDISFMSDNTADENLKEVPNNCNWQVQK